MLDAQIHQDFWDRELNGTEAEANFWEYGLKNSLLQGYFKFMVDVAVLLGADKTKAKDELKEVMVLENQLANIKMSTKDSKDPKKAFNLQMLKNFNNNGGFPSSWTTYVKKLYKYEDEDLKIKEDEIVIISDKNFYDKLGTIIASTNKKTLFNYIGWRVAKDSLNYLTPEARKVSQKFDKLMTGVKANKPRWKACLEEVGFNTGAGGTFAVAVSSMYARYVYNTVSEGSKKEVLDMTEYVRKAFDKLLDEVKWMDNETKKKAKTKLTNMKQFMAYPDESLDKDKVDGFYDGLELDVGKYFENTLKVAKHLKKNLDLSLRKVAIAGEWTGRHVAVVNAMYMPFSNAIQFPAGILQGMLELIYLNGFYIRAG